MELDKVTYFIEHEIKGLLWEHGMLSYNSYVYVMPYGQEMCFKLVIKHPLVEYHSSFIRLPQAQIRTNNMSKEYLETLSKQAFYEIKNMIKKESE